MPFDGIPTALAQGFVALLPLALLLAHLAYYRLSAGASTAQRFELVDWSGEHFRFRSIVGDKPKQVHRRLPNQLREASVSVAEGDLFLTGATRFTQPLKVTGDLVVDELAVFNEVVIVDGYVHVTGHAKFHAGLVCKATVHVDGRADFGSHGRPGWCVANAIVGEPVTAPPQVRADHIHDSLPMPTAGRQQPADRVAEGV